MDFMFLYLVYVALFAAGAIFVLIAPTSPILSALLNKIKHAGYKVVQAAVPDVVQNVAKRVVHYVFYTKNHVMQICFGVLVMGGNAILIRDVLPLLYIFEPDINHITLPMIFLFSNAVAFHLSCATDPGQITSTNAAVLASLYKADGRMYKQAVQCSTCHLVKPPRSKHCSICKSCVHRFDHHCIWTNNCVGAGNTRYFVPFLLTLLAMVINGCVMGTRAMMLYTEHLHLMEKGYEDPTTGQFTPVTIPILLQYLFMHHPRCVFLISSLFMLTILLGLFTLYHVYLVSQNQTTNERYKISALTNGCSNNNDATLIQGSSSNGGVQNVNERSVSSHTTSSYADMTTATNVSSGLNIYPISHLSGNGLLGKQIPQKRSGVRNNQREATAGTSANVHTKISAEQLCMTNPARSLEEELGNFYNRGLWANLKEVFLPWASLKEKLRQIERESFANARKKVKRQR